MQYRSNPARGNPDIPVNRYLASFRQDWTDNRWSEEEYGETPLETDREQVAFWDPASRYGVETTDEVEFVGRVIDHFLDGLLNEYEPMT